MALRAREIISAARFAHPAFDRALAPTSVCAQLLSEGQRRLMLLAHQRNPSYGVQRWTIRLLPDQNIAQVGAGLDFGAPIVTGSTSLSAESRNVGSAVTVDADVSTYVPPRAVVSATLGTLTDTTQSWTVDRFIAERVRIVFGTGAGQLRSIASNTADTLTLTEDWAVLPDATSVYTVEQNLSEVGGEFGVQLAEFPALVERQGFLVKLDAAGSPYIDLATPITVTGFVGIPMPPASFVDHGIVRFLDSAQVPDHVEPFILTNLSQQKALPAAYCGAVVNGSLQLFGPIQRWWQVVSIELPYLPIPPAVQAENDLLTLREDATEALVAQVVLGLCRRAKIMGRAGADGINDVQQRANDQETIWLDTVAGRGRAKKLTIREVW